MLKLLKYEIIGKYKSMLILIIGMLILNTGLVLKMGSWPEGISLVFSILIAVAAWVVLLVWCIGIFGQDVYEDKGYLTYTLPQKGYSIIASKLIFSFIYFIIVAVIAGLFIRYFACSTSSIVKLMDTSGIMVNTWGVALGGALYYGFSFVELLVTIYFAIALTRVAIRKKTAGKFAAFVVFIVINIAKGFVSYFLAKLFPQQLYLKLFVGASGAISQSVTDNQQTADLIANGLPINIASIVMTLALFIGFYIATSYIIENKIDL